MNTAERRYLSYAEIRKRQSTGGWRQAEVPIEHAIALPLPTMRWQRPAYATFASPALRRPGQPLRQSAPDRWWAVDARNGHVLVYALTAILPYATGTEWTTIMLPPATSSIDEIHEQVSSIEVLMDAVGHDFFSGAPGTKSARSALSEALAAHIPAPLMPQYRALAPDFWAWLEA